MKRTSEMYLKKDKMPRFVKDIICTIILLVVLMFIGGISVSSASAQTDRSALPSSISIRDGGEWRYFKGLEGPPREWIRNGFNDTAWPIGSSGFGYGIGSNRTYLGDMRGNYSTVYTRREFTINNPETLTGMSLSVVCDGPFIAYLNGMEMIRTNTIQVSSGQAIGSPQVERFNLSGFVHELLSGINVLSVQCDNDDINSEDFSFSSVFEIVEIGGNQ